MNGIHAPEEASQYKDEWVAFSIDLKRVVGHGRTPTEAVEMAQKADEPHAFLLFVPGKGPDVYFL